MSGKRGTLHLQTVDELLGAPVPENSQVEISVDKIVPFEHHPFKVLDDEKMEELVKSIRENGVLTPVIVRPDDADGYEMISGHRRLRAAKIAGFATIPAIVKPMTDDEATIAMIDSNMQREEILPSERAFALKMKMDALRRRGYRSDLEGSTDAEVENGQETTCGLKVHKCEGSIQELTCGHEVHKFNESRTRDAIGKEMGMGGRQVQRYLRLTELIQELLDMVDMKKINLDVGVGLSYLPRDVQEMVYVYMKMYGAVRMEQVEALKTVANFDGITQEQVTEVLNEALPKRKERGRVSFSPSTLDRYFPRSYTTSQREEIIFQLLEKWADSLKERDTN